MNPVLLQILAALGMLALIWWGIPALGRWMASTKGFTDFGKAPKPAKALKKAKTKPKPKTKPKGKRSERGFITLPAWAIKLVAWFSKTAWPWALKNWKDPRLAYSILVLVLWFAWNQHGRLKACQDNMAAASVVKPEASAGARVGAAQKASATAKASLKVVVKPAPTAVVPPPAADLPAGHICPVCPTCPEVHVTADCEGTGAGDQAVSATGTAQAAVALGAGLRDQLPRYRVDLGLAGRYVQDSTTVGAFGLGGFGYVGAGIQRPFSGQWDWGMDARGVFPLNPQVAGGMPIWMGGLSLIY